MRPTCMGSCACLTFLSAPHCLSRTSVTAVETVPFAAAPYALFLNKVKPTRRLGSAPACPWHEVDADAEGGSDGAALAPCSPQLRAAFGRRKVPPTPLDRVGAATVDEGSRSALPDPSSAHGSGCLRTAIVSEGDDTVAASSPSTSPLPTASLSFCVVLSNFAARAAAALSCSRLPSGCALPACERRGDPPETSAAVLPLSSRLPRTEAALFAAPAASPTLWADSSIEPITSDPCSSNASDTSPPSTESIAEMTCKPPPVLLTAAVDTDTMTDMMSSRSLISACLACACCSVFCSVAFAVAFAGAFTLLFASREGKALLPVATLSGAERQFSVLVNERATLRVPLVSPTEARPDAIWMILPAICVSISSGATSMGCAA